MKKEFVFLPDALKDWDYWKKTGQEKICNRILELMESVSETPFTGIGRPEQLKYGLAGKWSRRITQEHRFVYEVIGNTIYILSLRGHYQK